MFLECNSLDNISMLQMQEIYLTICMKLDSFGREEGNWSRKLQAPVFCILSLSNTNSDIGRSLMLFQNKLVAISSSSSNTTCRDSKICKERARIAVMFWFFSKAVIVGWSIAVIICKTLLLHSARRSEKKEESPSLNMYVYATLPAKEKTQENERQALDLVVHSRRRRRRRISSFALFVHKSLSGCSPLCLSVTSW